MATSEIKLAISSRLENVALMGMAVNKMCSVTPLSEIESLQVELCVVEACNNVIKHGYGHEPHHELEVVVTLGLDRILISIRDLGIARKVVATPSLNYDPDCLATLPENGMGLFLIHQIMDHVHYETTEGRNVLTLTKLFHSNSGPSRF